MTIGRLISYESIPIVRLKSTTDGVSNYFTTKDIPRDGMEDTTAKTFLKEHITT